MTIRRKLRSNITGKTFGRLTAISFVGRGSQNKAIWRYRCVCGKEIDRLADSVRSSKKQSCGCWNIERARELGYKKRTHGKTKTTEYVAYISAKRRCNDPNVRRYERYGGRGIKFKFESFEQWLEELGLRPPDKTSVDRINNNGHYEPGNVR